MWNHSWPILLSFHRPVFKELSRPKACRYFRWSNLDSFCSLSFFKKMAYPGLLFFTFVFSIQLTVNVQYKFLPMPGFELQTSEVGSNGSTNWATSIAHFVQYFKLVKRPSLWAHIQNFILIPIRQFPDSFLCYIYGFFKQNFYIFRTNSVENLSI